MIGTGIAGLWKSRFTSSCVASTSTVTAVARILTSVVIARRHQLTKWEQRKLGQRWKQREEGGLRHMHALWGANNDAVDDNMKASVRKNLKTGIG